MNNRRLGESVIGLRNSVSWCDRCLIIRKGSCWTQHFMVKSKKTSCPSAVHEPTEAKESQGSHQKLVIDSSKGRIVLSWLKEADTWAPGMPVFPSFFLSCILQFQSLPLVFA